MADFLQSYATNGTGTVQYGGTSNLAWGWNDQNCTRTFPYICMTLPGEAPAGCLVPAVYLSSTSALGALPAQPTPGPAAPITEQHCAQWPIRLTSSAPYGR